MGKQINYKAVPKIVIPTNYYSVIEDVPEYELGKVFKMLFVYCMKDDQIQYRYQQMFEMYNSDPHIRHIFKLFQITLDEQLEKYARICERNAKNGLLGGRPKKAHKPKPATPKEPIEVQPYSLPFIYEHYPSISTSTYWDYEIL